MEESARLDVSDRRTPCDRPWPILRSSTICKHRPSPAAPESTRSNRGTPCDRPRPISRSPTICRSRPGSMSQIVGLLAIGLGQSRGARRSGGVGAARLAQIVGLLATGPSQSPANLEESHDLERSARFEVLRS